MNFKNRHTKEKRHIHIIFTGNGKKLHTFYERSELIKESISWFKVYPTLSVFLNLTSVYRLWLPNYFSRRAVNRTPAQQAHMPP